jgi:L-iditol 2-dehydrogenase
MRVLRLHAPGDLRLHDEPSPEAVEDETLLRVTSVGICGSDLHWMEDGAIGDARLERPLVLGHEFAGVAESGPYRGRLVAVDPAVPCNTCFFCLDGNPNFCETIRFAGHGNDDGSLREQLAWPTRCLFPLPASFSAEVGAMLEPLGVAIHAGDLARLRPGMSVGVFGAGPIGLLVIQIARAAGATRILATDPHPHRLEAALAAGATDVVRAQEDGGELGEIAGVAGRRGFDVAFEAAGENAAVEVAVGAVRAGGRVVLLGIPSDDRTTFGASIARRKGLTIMLVRRMKHTYPRAIDLVHRGLVDVGSLISHRYALADYAEAFATALRRDGLKVMVEPARARAASARAAKNAPGA